MIFFYNIIIILQAIFHSAIKSRKPKSKTVCKMPWWSKTLCAIRNQLREAQNVFKLCPTKENRSKVNSIKGSYQTKKSKWENWKTLCCIGSSEDPYRTLRRLSSKPTFNQDITELNINGNLINNPYEILINFGNPFFSEPNNTLNLSQKEMFDRTNAYLNET